MLNINKIEKLRKSNGVTIDDFAEKLSINRATYFNLKKSRDFRTIALEKMSELFNVPIGFLFDEVELEEENATNRSKDQELEDLRYLLEFQKKEIISLKTELKKAEEIKEIENVGK